MWFFLVDIGWSQRRTEFCIHEIHIDVMLSLCCDNRWGNSNTSIYQSTHLGFNEIIDFHRPLLWFSTTLLPVEPNWPSGQSITGHSVSPRHRIQPYGRIFNQTQSHQSFSRAPNSSPGGVYLVAMFFVCCSKTGPEHNILNLFLFFLFF